MYDRRRVARVNMVYGLLQCMMEVVFYRKLVNY